MEHVYNGKENTKYLKLLKQNYSSSQAVIREIVNLTAITNLPKGTEFFLSDIHGEYEAFLHIMNNCSGVIKEKVDLIFKDTLSEFDRQELCTLIYYPREKMTLLGETNRIDGNWYAVLGKHARSRGCRRHPHRCGAEHRVRAVRGVRHGGRMGRVQGGRAAACAGR